MDGSVYKVIEIVGTSRESWEQAAQTAMLTAARSLRDIRVGEVLSMDLHIEDDKSVLYRTKLKVSFRYHNEE